MKESHLEELPVKEIQDFHVSFSNILKENYLL
jgi:hypothetical protein